MSGRLVCGAFIPRDENDRYGVLNQVVWHVRAVGWLLTTTRIVKDTTAPFWMQKGHFLDTVPQISSLKHHQPSNKILITSRDPGEDGGLYSLTFDSLDPYSPPPDGTSPPGWDLRRSNITHLHGWPRQGKSRAPVANTCTPAPASNNNLICVVGTSRGLGCFSGNGKMLWLDNLSPPPPNLKAGPTPASDVLSVDFLPRNPQVLVAGVRGSRRICLGDLRQNAREWDWMVHRSSPAHVRCLSEHHVLAAGPNHSMSIYDLRFRYRETYRDHPLVVFPEFKNDEQIHFGLDVDTSLGVVAAADCQPPGYSRQGMSVFSLETGKRLNVPALRDIDPASPPKALVFQTLPGETNASLFVGSVGGQVKKYSFGGNLDEWTGERFGPPAFETK
jgi:hypothetical protein